MPYPTTVRGLLGHFLCGADPPATNECASTPPVRSLLTAGAGERGAQGGASSCRSRRDGGGGKRLIGGKEQGRKGRASGKPGAERRTTATAVTATTTAQARRRQGQHDQVSSNRAGGEYRAKGGVKGESTDESAGWSGEESDGEATD